MDMDIKKYLNCKDIDTALTHSSYANENKKEGVECNERIEFLGDAVLGLITAEYLYKNYPDLPEGKLSKLRASVVCEDMLAKKARELGIDKLLRLGKGEESTGGRNRNSVISDAVEAVIACVYLDMGMEEARSFVLSMLEDEIKEKYSTHQVVDYKTRLQEFLQQKSHESIRYEIVSQSGPAHQRCFEAVVLHGERILGRGQGQSKKKAEQSAAMEALKSLNVEGM